MRQRVLGFIALTKPRIIELLLITTVPTMVVAEKGLPSVWLMLATVVGGSLSAGGANAVNMYVDRDIDGLPRQWIKMMMNSIGSLAWRYSAHRMVMDYTRTSYVPAAGGLSCDMNLH